MFLDDHTLYVSENSKREGFSSERERRRILIFLASFFLYRNWLSLGFLIFFFKSVVIFFIFSEWDCMVLHFDFFACILAFTFRVSK